MEARTTFRGAAKSRNLVALVTAVLAALMLAAIGGSLVKAISSPITAPAAHIVAGQPGASDYGSAWNYSTRRSGIQTVEGTATSPTSASLREPGTQRGGPQS
jgi:hypothetical protein